MSDTEFCYVEMRDQCIQLNSFDNYPNTDKCSINDRCSIMIIVILICTDLLFVLLFDRRWILVGLLIIATIICYRQYSILNNHRKTMEYSSYVVGWFGIICWVVSNSIAEQRQSQFFKSIVGTSSFSYRLCKRIHIAK